MSLQSLPQGSLFVWPDHWQVIGRLYPNRPHRHISASWLVGLDGPFRLEVDGQWRETRAAIVAPDVVQALDPGSTRMWCAQLDPDCPLWLNLRSGLQHRTSSDITLNPDHLPALTSPDCNEAAQALVRAVQALGFPATALDPRVMQVCEALRRDMPERVDVAALAGLVGLSASRLSHLFREQVGVPLRRFLLHLKINRVLAGWEPGRSMSELATEAGFYDQPHLVRTARNMFDALPSDYVSGGRFSVCRCGLASP